MRPVGLNEIRTNLNTIYTALGITRTGCGTGAGWSNYWPIQAGWGILTAHPQQLRDVTDYAYENMCPSDEVSHYTVAKTDYDTSHCTVHDTGENSGEFGTHWALHDINEDAPHYGNHLFDDNTGHDGGYYIVHWIGHHDDEDGPHYSTYCPGNYTGDLAADCPGHDVGVLGAYRGIHKNTEWAPHYYNEHTTAKYTEYGAADEGYLSNVRYDDYIAALFGQHGTYCNDDNTTHYNDDDYNEDTSHDFDHYSVYRILNDSSYNSAYQETYFSSQDTSEYSTYRGTYDSTDQSSYYPAHYVGALGYHDSPLH